MLEEGTDCRKWACGIPEKRLLLLLTNYWPEPLEHSLSSCSVLNPDEKQKLVCGSDGVLNNRFPVFTRSVSKAMISSSQTSVWNDYGGKWKS